MKSFFALLLLAALMAGCAKTVPTSLVTGQGMPPGQEYGKTAVLVWFAFDPKDAKGKRKVEKLREIIQARFAALPGMTVVDGDAVAKSLQPRTWRDVGDVELLAAARAAGVDSVALVEVASCAGDLGIGLTPLPTWSVVTRFSYRLRLLDVKSAILVRSAMRGQESGGMYAVRGLSDLLHDFDADLAAVLAAPAPQASLETH